MWYVVILYVGGHGVEDGTAFILQHSRITAVLCSALLAGEHYTTENL